MEARIAAAVSLPGSSLSSMDSSSPADRSAPPPPPPPHSTDDSTVGGDDRRQVDNSPSALSQRVPQPGPIPAATRVNPSPDGDDDAAVFYSLPGEESVISSSPVLPRFRRHPGKGTQRRICEFPLFAEVSGQRTCTQMSESQKTRPTPTAFLSRHR